MKLLDFCAILLSVLLNASAQIFIKLGTKSIPNITDEHANSFLILLNVLIDKYILAGLFCYVISIGVWIYALSKVDVSTAYPMLSIGYIVTVLIGWKMLNETITPMKIFGVVVIMIGVIIVARNSQ
jgi:drug/metabolite transporter (DMT)-like permease